MSEPEYYNRNGLSPLKAFERGLISYEEYIGFIKGNIIKYVVRCDKKGQGVSDVNKALDYCKLLKKELVKYENISKVFEDIEDKELSENEKLKNILKQIIFQIDKSKDYSTIMVQINNNDYDYFRDLMLEL
jgi:hypothetical protein